MKKIEALCLFLCCIILMHCIADPVTAAEPDLQRSQSYGCHSIDAETTVLGSGERIKNVQSVFLYETTSQTLMYEWNADLSTDPASLVKIMTAYVAIENGDLTDVITIKESLLDTLPDYALSVGLLPDEILTLEELLYCLLVGSGNDAAVVIADHICADQAAFVSMMNEAAIEMGCTGTNFVNVTGFYEETQVTTARDVARILNVALQNETFRTIFCTAEYDLPATNKSEKRFLATNNYLMADNQDMVTFYVDYRVKGGRTGISNDGLRSVAAVSESGNMELISVVIGSESEVADNGYSVTTFGSYQETSALLDLGFNGMKVAQILHSNLALTQQSVSNGECDVILCPQESVYAVLPQKANADSLNYRYTHSAQGIDAPIEKGECLSSVEIWSGGLCVGRADLYAMNSVALKQEDTSGSSSGGTVGSQIGTVLLWILGVVIGIILLLYTYRRIRIALIRRRRQKIMRSRRRSK